MMKDVNIAKLFVIMAVFGFIFGLAFSLVSPMFIATPQSPSFGSSFILGLIVGAMVPAAVFLAKQRKK